MWKNFYLKFYLLFLLVLLGLCVFVIVNSAHSARRFHIILTNDLGYLIIHRAIS